MDIGGGVYDGLNGLSSDVHFRYGWRTEQVGG